MTCVIKVYQKLMRKFKKYVPVRGLTATEGMNASEGDSGILLFNLFHIVVMGSNKGVCVCPRFDPQYHKIQEKYKNTSQ